MKKTTTLGLLVALFAIGLALHGPIPQWPGYHDFADRRAWLGLPNAADLLSNLPFLLIGLWGWRCSQRLHWRLFAVALAATAVGSALYHRAPDDFWLLFDRLPIAAACAVLACAFLAERADLRWARGAVLAASLLLAAASVALWWASELAGRSDLRAYLFVQFLPMLLVVAGLGLRLPPLRDDALPASAWWTTLALYAAAKAFELADQPVLQASGLVSGHTLKHLLAAAAAWWILRASIRSLRGLRSGNPR